MRYLVSLNVLCLYIIYVFGKLRPHPLHPMDGWIDYLALAANGICVVWAIFAVLSRRSA